MHSVVSALENWRRVVHLPANTNREKSIERVVITQRPGCWSHGCGVVNLCPVCDMMSGGQRNKVLDTLLREKTLQIYSGLDSGSAIQSVLREFLR